MPRNSTPAQPYFDAHCHALLARRQAARQAGATVAQINEITDELKRAARKAKRAFLLRSINEEDWGGIRRLRPFRPNHTRMRDETGRLRPAQERAEILATQYEKVWTPNSAWQDDGRDPLFGAAIIEEGDFTPAELRAVRKKIKRNKVSGTDEIPNEIILLLLSFSYYIILLLLSFLQPHEAQGVQPALRTWLAMPLPAWPLRTKYPPAGENRRI